MKNKLKVIYGSSRQGRKGLPIARWIFGVASEHSEFETEFLDLAEIGLPMLDEPNHPRLYQYQHQHTRDWSAKINPADAFIIVTPEYNYGYPAVLKNAIDFLHQEWLYKPVAFVSYGGVAGGTRAVQALRQVISSLKMVSITESVNIPFFAKLIGENQHFNPDEHTVKSANAMVAELARWSVNLKMLRNDG